MIMLHDILEHLHDSPRDLLNDLVELLKPGGLLFITLPNAANIRKRIQLLLGRTNLPPFEEYYWYPGPRRGHVREYVRDDLVQLLKYLDLETVELQGCDLRLQRLSAPLRYLFLVVTKIFPGWKDSWSLVARRGRDWTPRRALPRDQLESILGRRSAYHYSPYTNQ